LVPGSQDIKHQAFVGQPSLPAAGPQLILHALVKLATVLDEGGSLRWRHVRREPSELVLGCGREVLRRLERRSGFFARRVVGHLYSLGCHNGHATDIRVN
jgi:hypothetical protein